MGVIKMNKGTIKIQTGAINWDSLDTFPINRLYWSEKTDITAEAKICYDTSFLYVQLSARETHIRAEESGPLGLPCEDSCLEFFLSPEPEDKRYLNFEINPNGCIYSGIATSIDNLLRLVPENQNLFHPQTERTKNGWTATLQIPFSYLRMFFPNFEATPGKRVLANFYKCGDKTVLPHFLSWNELTSPVPNFHRPCDFGELYFE